MTREWDWLPDALLGSVFFFVDQSWVLGVTGQFFLRPHVKFQSMFARARKRDSAEALPSQCRVARPARTEFSYQL
jgi:hypothetical protein